MSLARGIEDRMVPHAMGNSAEASTKRWLQLSVRRGTISVALVYLWVFVLCVLPEGNGTTSARRSKERIATLRKYYHVRTHRTSTHAHTHERNMRQREKYQFGAESL